MSSAARAERSEHAAIWRAAMLAGIRWGRDALLAGVDRDTALHGAASVTCHLMVLAGMRCREVAAWLQVSADLVADLAMTADEARDRDPPFDRWLSAVAAHMPMVEIAGGDARVTS